MKPHLLAITNDPDTLNLLRLALEPDYRLTPAADPQTGLRLFRQARPDLALLDITLPGRDLCAELRRLAPAPIIILAAPGETGAEVIRALSLGADDYLARPLRPDLLRARVQALLRRTAPAPGSLALLVGRAVQAVPPGAGEARFSLLNADGLFFIKAAGPARPALAKGDEICVIGRLRSYREARSGSNRVWLQAEGILPPGQVQAVWQDRLSLAALLRTQNNR